MPEVGEVRKDVIGKKRSRYFTWTPCPKCGNCRWIQRGNEDRSKLCRGCYLKERKLNPLKGEKHWAWKGGKWKHRGYTLIKLPPDSEYFGMAAKNGTVPEHRLMMAKNIGRLLLKSEEVHHIDGDRSNNEIGNLELISPANHTLYKRICSRCNLRKQNWILKARIKELTKSLL